jgi:heptosyltransferase-2
MSTPAVQRLHERFPEAHITVFTHRKLAELWTACPSVNSVLTFDSGEGILSAARRLRAGGFDLALVLPNSPRSALEPWLAGVPQRVGYARRWRRWLMTRAVPSRPGSVRMRQRSSLEIQRLVSEAEPSAGGIKRRSAVPAEAHSLYDYLHLVAALGCRSDPTPPRLAVETDRVDQARAALNDRVPALPKSGMASSRIHWLGMNPSAAYGPAKRWPAERFAAVAREVSRRVPETVWLAFGEAADQALCQQVASAANVPFINLAGQTSLRELMGFLSLCLVLLTNDSGPMHLGAALGVPVVVPFGSTSPELTGPGLPGQSQHQLFTSHAPCSPCFRRTCPIDFRCMREITVERVVAGVLQSLGHP